MVFGNDNSETNGEAAFFKSIKDSTNIIFDIGCRNDSQFLQFDREVHYFDPIGSFIDDLASQSSCNNMRFLNKFGLSDKEDTLEYFPQFQSFHERNVTFRDYDRTNHISLRVRKATDYIREMNIGDIDFVKIDTEGHELAVLIGFEDDIRKVGIIQFEYGGTFQDTGVKLRDVVDHLTEKGFGGFAYLGPDGIVKIDDFSDHYVYCNIVCFNLLKIKAYRWSSG